MAMRTVARRWPAGASQLRTLLRPSRLQQQQQSRAYAEEYTGQGLNEKEKAAENRFIRQKEEEMKLKRAAAATAAGEVHPDSPVTPAAAAEKIEGGFPTVPVLAGLFLAVGAYWFVTAPSKKDEKESS